MKVSPKHTHTNSYSGNHEYFLVYTAINFMFLLCTKVTLTSLRLNSIFHSQACSCSCSSSLAGCREAAEPLTCNEVTKGIQNMGLMSWLDNDMALMLLRVPQESLQIYSA